MTKFSWLALIQRQPHDVLDAKARAVAAALVMEADRDALTVAAGIAALTERTALHRASVIRALAELEHDCWIRVRKGGGGAKGQSRRVTNTYSMEVPSWAKSGSHCATQTGDSGSHCATQTEGRERTSGSHSATLLRGELKMAAEDPEHAPIKGQAIRDILTGRDKRSSSLSVVDGA